MIKPASSGDLRITTDFFFSFLPSLSFSLPAQRRYNYWGHKSSCAAAESQPNKKQKLLQTCLFGCQQPAFHEIRN